MLKSDPRAKQGLADIDELEDRIDKLRQNYESYFSGVDNIDPAEKKIPIRRLITKLNEMHLLNPRSRFRFQTLVGRFVTLEQYWTRTMHMIEDGRLKRGFFRIPKVGAEGPKTFFSKESVDMSHLASVQETAAEAAAAAASRPTAESIEELNAKRLAKLRGKPFSVLTALREEEAAAANEGEPVAAAAPAPKPAAPAPKPVARPPISAERIETLYSELVNARKASGITEGEVNKDALKAQLLRQAQLLREKYSDKDVDFRVVNKDGKILMQPVVRRAREDEDG